LETPSIDPVVTRRVGCWVVASVGLLLVLLPAIPSGGFIGFRGLSDPVVEDVLVSSILGSCNNFQFAGYDPRSQIVFLWVEVLANDFGHTRFISGIASLLAIVHPNPGLVQPNFFFLSCHLCLPLPIMFGRIFDLPLSSSIG
jgi:hypothetical protein